jgi:hypothetical protein
MAETIIRGRLVVRWSDDLVTGRPYQMSRRRSSTGGRIALGSGLAEQVAAARDSVIALLALSNDGAPAYDHDNAHAFADIGIPTIACTPDQFPT